MNLDDYQFEAQRTSVYPGTFAIPYLALKLNGEAGEVAELVGKWLRGDDVKKDEQFFNVRTPDYPLGILARTRMTPERREALLKELGDVLWYLATLSAELGWDLSTVALHNLEKLRDRKERGVLQGSGSDR